jgi:hypothetical protein
VRQHILFCRAAPSTKEQANVISGQLFDNPTNGARRNRSQIRRKAQLRLTFYP